MHRITRLENGFLVITDSIANVHSLSIGIWIKTGGRYENKGNQGISHLMEHMLFKGTKKLSCQGLKRSIESKGGSFNAFTSEENVCYYIKILSKQLNLAGGILADMVLEPALRPDDIDKEKKVIFEEIRMYLDLPMHYVHDLLDSLIWPEHPLGLSLVGTYETVGRVSRNDLIRLKKQFHVPNNMAIVACGDIKHDDVVSIMRGLFDKEKPVKQVISQKPLSNLHSQNIKFMQKDTEQTHLCLGLRALSSRHRQRYAFALLNIILGGNMSSRLFNEIREKRSLAYEIGSSLKAYSDTGSFVIHAGIDNKKLKNVVSLMVNELNKAKKNFVTKRELETAKEYFKSGLLMTLESTMSNMLFLGEQITVAGSIQTKEDILNAVEKVTPYDIKEVAEKFLVNKALRLAVIGPQDEKEISETKTIFS
jgi:predicted Zn-dependent peptidase